jgi:hypothetical protein
LLARDTTVAPRRAVAPPRVDPTLARIVIVVVVVVIVCTYSRVAHSRHHPSIVSFVHRGDDVDDVIHDRPTDRP